MSSSLHPELFDLSFEFLLAERNNAIVEREKAVKALQKALLICDKALEERDEARLARKEERIARLRQVATLEDAIHKQEAKQRDEKETQNYAATSTTDEYILEVRYSAKDQKPNDRTKADSIL
ncbi:hypothetical protein CYLTODRAFT_443425 [Cylindrobasidium torrendii FP15055 ss-10]|uniref:Uncharacterized protein n=1 Tax=Cylindrobasidium torrendii FP15055 ss-10 TaxID=1314674 RepID=A0A0D7BDN1_9AGAR|nr:hypothetical protein CYLTODRAFT_443425 [Cylindrobasidium torrendii FP15055 ss-10]